jgi:hypothetical protein
MVEQPRKRMYKEIRGLNIKYIRGGQAKGRKSEFGRNELYLPLYLGSFILFAGKGKSLYQGVRYSGKAFTSGSFSGKTLMELVFQEKHCSGDCGRVLVT